MKNRNYEEPKEEEVVVEEEVKTPVKPARPKKYTITVNNLALREGPGKTFEIIGVAEPGHTKITEIENGYGKLADGTGWVNMNYVRKAD